MKKAFLVFYSIFKNLYTAEFWLEKVLSLSCIFKVELKGGNFKVNFANGLIPNPA